VLRQLLQEQVYAATCWQQLDQLLRGRRDALTLKHLSLMATQTARLQAAEARTTQLGGLQQQQQHHHQQQQRNSGPPGAGGSTGLSSEAAAAAAAASAAAQSAYLAALAAAASEALTASQPNLATRHERIRKLASTTTTAAAAADGSDADGSDAAADSGKNDSVLGGCDSSSVRSGAQEVQQQPPPARAAAGGMPGSSAFVHSDGPLCTYLADLLWGFARLRHAPADEHLGLWVQAFAAASPSADGVSLAQLLWSLATLQFWPGGDVMDALLAELALRMDAAVAATASPGTTTTTTTTTAAATATAVTAAAGGSAAAVRRPQQLLCARGLSNVLWALATLDCAPPAELTASRLWEGSQGCLPGAAPQALASMLWAVAALGLAPSPAWMRAWADAAGDGLARGTWNCADVANASWALGRLACVAATRHVTPVCVTKAYMHMHAHVCMCHGVGDDTTAACRDLLPPLVTQHILSTPPPPHVYTHHHCCLQGPAAATALAVGADACRTRRSGCK
jgi:hypothetical protein